MFCLIRGRLKISTKYSPTKYSLMPLDDFDVERHITLDDALDLVSSQTRLDHSKLSSAAESGELVKYDFNGTTYVDRIDIGRIYHEPITQRQGLKIRRHFTDGKINPLDTVGPYETGHIEIKDYKTGETIFEMDDAEFPASWDENDKRIVAQKYFYKPDEPEWKEKLTKNIGSDHEHSIKHLATRTANFFADEGYRLGHFATEADRDSFRDELLYLQINRMFAFNSPVQFNAGLYNEYGITGSPAINFFRNSETGEVTRIEEGCNVKPQCHACFIKGPRDNLEDILTHSVREGGIFSSGSGIGGDIGRLRSSGEALSGGGEASGSLSFLKVYDDWAGTIKSGGKSRRAARMTTMRQGHPNVMEFIKSKVREDKKALTLMEAGYDGSMDGEAWTTVTFQNTNISVRLDDYFFEQVENGGDIELRGVKTGEILGSVSAEEMLKQISFGSWRVGDPGVQYESKMQEMHTCKNSGRQNSTNPCSEYSFIDDTSCNLGSLNLVSFTDERGNFDVESYEKATRIATIALDIANDAASYPVEEIATISPEFGAIGLGYANLGGLLMRRGVPYDSEEGRALASGLTALMTGTSYKTSAEIAKHLGTFTHFELNRTQMLDVMKKHQKSLENILSEHVPEEIMEAARKSWKSVIANGQRYGFRNAQTTLLAPTGTISYLLGCDTSTGVEPLLALRINKNLAGGGNITLRNKEVPIALENLGYLDMLQHSEILEFIEQTGGVTGAPHLSPEHYNVFENALGSPTGEGSLPFTGHLEMLAATQPFLSGAISKTNNLPHSATVKDVYDGYIMGHNLGLKAITIFRDNSKPISALSFSDQQHRKLKRGEVEDMPSGRPAFEKEVEINGTQFHVMVSEYPDGRPGQIVFLSYKAGSPTKAQYEIHGISASKALKRGVHLDDVVDGWADQKFDPTGMVTGHDYIKTALSPLDFAYKLLMLEYRGRTDLADDSENVDITNLQGFKNGAFETYRKAEIDDWDFEQVIKDPELGGFKKDSNSKRKKLPKTNGKPKSNERGITCPNCGNFMRPTGSNCYDCNNCGEKLGGCGI